MTRPTTGCAAVLAGLALAAGCAAPAYHVRVGLSPRLKAVYKTYPTVEVDVVGLDANALARFGSVSVEDYFRPGNALRASAPHATLRFSQNDVEDKTLSGDDPVWEAFGETASDRLCLMANLPPAAPRGKDAAAAVDGRRVIIALEKDCFLNPRRWFGWPTRVFDLVPAGINLRRY